MADINIQRKKTSLSPWLLVLLAAVVLAVAAYFFLKPDPADEPAPPVAETAAPATAPDTLSEVHAIEQATRQAGVEGIPPGDTPAANVGAEAADNSETVGGLTSQAAGDPAAPDYVLHGLQKLTGLLVAMADRDDLRDPTVSEQRDNLTSATNRLGEANASLRPGFVAAAGLMRAMQQKAYPDLQPQADELVALAGQLSGRSAAAAEQRQNQQFLTQAAAVVRVLNEPK